MAIVVIIAILLAGGVSVTAETTTPGDVLYPVKVSVNEKVRSAFALSTEGKGELHAHLAGRRLTELEKLAARSELTAEVNTDLSSRFEDEVVAYNEQIAKLKADGNAEGAARASAEFKAVLKAHETTLANLTADDTGILDAALRAKISVLSQGVTVLRARAETTEAESRAEASSSTNVESSSTSNTNSGSNSETNAEVRSNTSVNSGGASSSVKTEGTIDIGL